ncbi:hypothetical protein LuPra_04109 [Luteitalea pratensis]|uniref:Uncharacterized protein n=2 Tax=Luteitalea pratensis TaxID=1855912 RepID=A0A143PR77_LUTPR|nr:hypothetical protein LuPra_04109 [Luteitalea pratensis]
MLLVPGRARAFALLVAIVAVPAAVAIAQQGPVGAMFESDKARHASREPSFQLVDLPATKADQSPLRVYLSAGDLERAFDRPEFRPAAAIVPTNTDLSITAPQPATQRVLVSRVQKQPEVMRDLEDQIAARQKQPAANAAGEPGVLRIGVDTFVAQLPRSAMTPANANFPKAACLIATEFAQGGAVDRRELYAQDRVRRGVAACLTALDAAGAQSIVLPQMGAASSETQTHDAMYEGQRTLMECRLINSTAGIALGIHDFAASRRNLREIGVVQWERELDLMFKVPPDSRAAGSAQAAYRAYAEQVREAFRRGLAGEKTTVGHVKGSCTAILDVQ